MGCTFDVLIKIFRIRKFLQVSGSTKFSIENHPGFAVYISINTFKVSLKLFRNFEAEVAKKKST